MNKYITKNPTHPHVLSSPLKTRVEALFGISHLCKIQLEHLQFITKGSRSTGKKTWIKETEGSKDLKQRGQAPLLTKRSRIHLPCSPEAKWVSIYFVFLQIIYITFYILVTPKYLNRWPNIIGRSLSYSTSKCLWKMFLDIHIFLYSPCISSHSEKMYLIQVTWGSPWWHMCHRQPWWTSLPPLGASPTRKWTPGHFSGPLEISTLVKESQQIKTFAFRLVTPTPIQ